MANSTFKSISKTLLENSAYDKNSNTLFVTNPGISYNTLRGLAKKHGFTIGQTKSGNYVSIPLSAKYNDFNENYVSLYDSFMETYTYFSKNYAALLAAYRTFDLMDENLAEVGTILDTYVAEVLSQGFTDNPLKITISDSKAQSLVEKILYKNKIYQKLPNITRSLAKYGNYGMVLHYPYLNKWLDMEKHPDFTQIDVLEDLNIRFVNPKYFKVNTDEYMNVINYETTDENTYVARPQTAGANNIVNVWQPWQFVHFLLADEITEPYGKSMLWSMRSAFDQLSTLEALLGISRASKIQRLVFWVPLPRDTAITDSYGYMNEFRSNYLNSIFTDAPGAKAGRKIPGATSILTLPKAADGTKVDIDHIEANIDLSSTEDVDYFKDKIYNNSKLPKGYLVGEDVITTAQTLEAQDLKLKRALIPLKKGLIEGIMNLVENILTHCGYDVSKLDVKVSLNEPIQVPADVISKYSDIADLLKSFKEVNPNMPSINAFQLLVKLGMPTDVSALILQNSATNTLTTPEDLSKFLNKQKVKQKGSAVEEIPEEGGVEESISVSSKTFLMENTFLHRKLKEFRETNTTSLDRSLKEQILLPTKKVLTEQNDK